MNSGRFKLPQCDCAAATEGKWAGVHHPSCALLQRDRDRICNGDGQEGERLWGLVPGHVLTEADVVDIRNLISDHSDEIGKSAELFHAAYQTALANAAPDKVDLLNMLDETRCNLSIEKALRKCGIPVSSD